MERLTKRRSFGLIGNNDRVEGYPLYKVAQSDPLDHGIIGQCFNKLADYEDAEEQGLLLKPKVALNSFVYWDSGYWGIIPYKVCNISYSIHGFCYEICAFNGDELLDDQEVVDDDFGKYAFFTYEEAEKKRIERFGQ